ncbi:CLK4-associating serine/arginine rich protein-like isoform X2 [Patiria miniata]|uniref:Suppressor of white apricot N-terminal domain-containing protein n=1 Tax=Patiria miniata TaxID=46514 RepID=A0A913Z7E4_PATMI|nr:CLK4-associating serine/arginine rich protein-like isoform X2 [Patiria miniata]
MWHEAKKQERKIHGIIVDYRKRAERRREFYEKIKQDPTQFLRVHAAACKIHLDPAVALAAEGPGTMMPWQGDTSVMIDRFDARAHLDFISGQSVISAISPTPQEPDEDKCFYERYRTLVQNEGAGISEEQCLNQIRVDEMFPDVTGQKPNDDKEKLKGKRAAIGFSYDDGSKEAGEEEDEEEEGEDSQDSDDDSSSDTSLSDIDIDINVDVDELTDEQKAELNSVGERYGMKPNEYVRMLERDKHELDMQKRFKEIEEEKALYSGRKSRRERRMLVEKRLRARGDDKLSPPSYASRDSPTYQDYRHSRSRSRSRSTTPEDTGKVTFITSFGEEQEEERKERLAGTQGSGKAAAASTKASKSLSGSESHAKSRHHRHSPSSSSSRSRSRSPARGRPRYHSRSRSSSRSSSRGRHRRGSSSSRSYSRSRSRSRSRSPHRGYRRSRSRSADRHGASHHSYNRYRRSRSKSPIRSSHGWAGRPRSRSRSRDRYRARSRSRSPERRNRHLQSPGSVKSKRSGESSVGKTPGSVDKKQLTPKERLKLKMQKALNKQHKADKIKQNQKQSAKEQEQMEREEELREMTRQFRYKEQERRDRDRSEKAWRGRAHNPPRSRSRSRSPERRRRSGRDRYSPARGRSRSRSYSPRPAQYRY